MFSIENEKHIHLTLYLKRKLCLKNVSRNYSFYLICTKHNLRIHAAARYAFGKDLQDDIETIVLNIQIRISGHEAVVS